MKPRIRVKAATASHLTVVPLRKVGPDIRVVEALNVLSQAVADDKVQSVGIVILHRDGSSTTTCVRGGETLRLLGLITNLANRVSADFDKD